MVKRSTFSEKMLTTLPLSPDGEITSTLHYFCIKLHHFASRMTPIDTHFYIPIPSKTRFGKTLSNLCSKLATFHGNPVAKGLIEYGPIMQAELLPIRTVRCQVFGKWRCLGRTLCDWLAIRLQLNRKDSVLCDSVATDRVAGESQANRVMCGRLGSRCTREIRAIDLNIW